MKFNWGIGITIVILAFMTFILSFVFKAANINTDLTSEDYYEQEINYQPTIDAKNNAASIKQDFKFNQQDDLFIISFPTSTVNIKNGNLHFYRPDNANLDKYYSLELSNGQMAIPLSSLKVGDYKLTISWTDGVKDYIVQEIITI